MTLPCMERNKMDVLCACMCRVSRTIRDFPIYEAIAS